jgi:hypothetical protein
MTRSKFSLLSRRLFVRLFVEDDGVGTLCSKKFVTRRAECDLCDFTLAYLGGNIVSRSLFNVGYVKTREE